MAHSDHSQSPFMSSNVLFTPKKSNNQEKELDNSSPSVILIRFRLFQKPNYL